MNVNLYILGKTYKKIFKLYIIYIYFHNAELNLIFFNLVEYISYVKYI